MSTDEEKLISTHLKALSSHYSTVFKSMKFKPPYIDPKDKGSVVSVSEVKREAFISRHHIFGHYLSDSINYAVILKDDCLDRL